MLAPPAEVQAAGDALRCEAQKSESVLKTALAPARRPLRASGLWLSVRDCVTLCGGTFEKAYLSVLAGRLTGAAEGPARLLGISAELLMFAALAVDDWSDDSQIRNNRPALHITHGASTAILSAFVLTEVAQATVDRATKGIPPKFSVKIRTMFRRAQLAIQTGQGRIKRVNNDRHYSLAQIESISRQRCGLLIAAAMGTPALLAKHNAAAVALAQAGVWTGLALQHRNDIIDFTIAFDQNIKPPLADLLNAQPNLVSFYLWNALPRMTTSERRLLTRLHGIHLRQPQHQLIEEDYDEIIALADKCMVIPQALKRLDRCLASARGCLHDRWSDTSCQELFQFFRLVGSV